MAFNIQRYMTRGVVRVVTDSLRATSKNEKERAFMKQFAKASRSASKKRYAAEKQGEHIPPFLIASITSSCNLHCAGCYSRSNNACCDSKPVDQLTAEEWNKIFTEADELGISFILLAGGEPMMRYDVIKQAAGHKLTHYPYTAPTSTKDGNVEYWYCDECHKYFSDENGENEITETVIPLVPEYSFDSDRLEWTKDSGKDLEFTVNRSADDDKTFGLFLGIEIDGNAVSEENYTATKGSVNINLSADYLETLSVGEHTLKLLLNDGEAETTFTVNGKEEPAEPDGENTNEPATEPEKKDSKPAEYEPIPKTGNSFNPWICIAVLAGSCLAAVYGRKRKEDE